MSHLSSDPDDFSQPETRSNVAGIQASILPVPICTPNPCGRVEQDTLAPAPASMIPGQGADDIDNSMAADRQEARIQDVLLCLARLLGRQLARELSTTHCVRPTDEGK